MLRTVSSGEALTQHLMSRPGHTPHIALDTDLTLCEQHLVPGAQTRITVVPPLDNFSWLRLSSPLTSLRDVDLSKGQWHPINRICPMTHHFYLSPFSPKGNMLPNLGIFPLSHQLTRDLIEHGLTLSA